MNLIENFSHGFTRIITDENEPFLDIRSTMIGLVGANPCSSVAGEVLE
jgi:hypothetical protein